MQEYELSLRADSGEDGILRIIVSGDAVDERLIVMIEEDLLVDPVLMEAFKEFVQACGKSIVDRISRGKGEITSTILIDTPPTSSN